MANIECCFYITEVGKSPVESFIKVLDPRTRRKFYYVKSLLETFGRKLPYPHAKNIGDDIFELRFRGREGHIRTLYFFFSEETVVFTNGFVKKTNKTPKNEKQTAVERREDYFKRFGKK